jgi:NarL family two-component system response regulator LiaR
MASFSVSSDLTAARSGVMRRPAPLAFPDQSVDDDGGPRNEPARARLLLVDDHAFVRYGLRAMYGELGNIRIDWVEAATLEEAIERYRDTPEIDAVLLDLNLADCKGLQGLRTFLGHYPEAKVAIFSGTQDEFVIGQARALGAVGYFGKGSQIETLRDTLHQLVRAALEERKLPNASNSPFFPKAVNASMYDRVAELGVRHLEILELVLSGCTNHEISSATNLSLGTVKNYVSALLLALDVRSRSHLISLFR